MDKGPRWHVAPVGTYYRGLVNKELMAVSDAWCSGDVRAIEEANKKLRALAPRAGREAEETLAEYRRYRRKDWNMMCTDCQGALMSLEAVADHASEAAQTIAASRSTLTGAMGVYSLLLVARLSTRCLACAEKYIGDTAIELADLPNCG